FYNVGVNALGMHKVAAYRPLFEQMGQVLGAWTAAFLALIAFAFVLKMSDAYSRVWLVGWFLMGAAGLVLFRLGLRAMVLRWTAQGRLRRRTAIVGGGSGAGELIAAIEGSAYNDIELVGVFDDRDDARSPGRIGVYPKLGRVADLVDFSRRARLDLVIVALPMAAETRVLQMLKQLWVLPVDIRLSAHTSKLRFKARAYSYLGEVAMLDVIDKPISDWNVVLKWMFDKSVALVALAVLSPVMIAAALAVKLTGKGPVLFRQQRHGFNNELIEVFKFRSMHTELTDVSAAKLVTRDDPRVTLVGRYLRRSSIDELPQLFNVLKGELSIVGPRPHALEAKAADTLYHEAVDGYFARHRVKPGITGWAQINGWRGETDTVDKIMQRVNHDLYYIENWSILLDLYIVLMTPFSLIGKTEGAY
ncbi:MAG TPA: undecaprenyl-phosphate glucose phosphotransferase, partial [Devosiaceae bacterium]|nr:undecaprenyl-phosphate glucose phosphotransferase [Devosiaceae bacterium]